MTSAFAETLVRGVIRCPGCGAPGIWLAESNGPGSFVIQISRAEASLLMREFSEIKTLRSSTFLLLEQIPRALGAEITRVLIQPDGRGRMRAEIEVARGDRHVRIPAYVGDAVVIARRYKLRALVPRSLLVHHEGHPVPSCPNEDSGLPPAPREFVEFIERINADDFRG